LGKKIVISADTTCDLPPEILDKYGISQIPLYISFGDTSYRDGVEITPDEIYQKFEAEGVLPKTSAISIGDFTEYFGRLLEDAQQVVHFSISSGLSCTYQNALIAAKEFPGRVFPVDTLNLSTGQAMMIIRATELAAEGVSAESIVEDAIAYRKRVDANFVIESLEFLHKGGRCSALTALGANLLSIKPCIQVFNGKMDVGKKYRGKFKIALQKYLEERLSTDDLDGQRAFLTYAGCSAEIVDFTHQLVLESGLFQEVFLTRAGCTISSHCGPNTLGLIVARKQDLS